MTNFDAVMIAEGEQEASHEDYIAAWQHLEDTGLGYRLQGWFGRRLRELIAAGEIREARQ